MSTSYSAMMSLPMIANGRSLTVIDRSFSTLGEADFARILRADGVPIALEYPGGGRGLCVRFFYGPSVSRYTAYARLA